MDNKLKTMISFCKRSGNLLSGDVQVSNAMSKKKAKLIIIAEDVSENNKKNFVSKCEHHKADYLIFGQREEINELIGDYNKTVFCVIDDNFANRIKELILAEQTEMWFFTSFLMVKITIAIFNF